MPLTARSWSEGLRNSAALTPVGARAIAVVVLAAACSQLPPALPWSNRRR